MNFGNSIILGVSWTTLTSHVKGEQTEETFLVFKPLSHSASKDVDDSQLLSKRLCGLNHGKGDWH